MTDALLPPDVYRLAQKEFEAISGKPWVYWIDKSIRQLFEKLPKLEDVAHPCQGMTTANNERFLRNWWEVGRSSVIQNGFVA